MLAVDQRIADHFALVVDCVRGAERPAQGTEPDFSPIPVNECDDGAIVAYMGIAGDHPRRIDGLRDAVAAAKSPDLDHVARIEQVRVSYGVAFQIGPADHLAGVIESERYGVKPPQASEVSNRPSRLVRLGRNGDRECDRRNAGCDRSRRGVHGYPRQRQDEPGEYTPYQGLIPRKV